MKSPSWNSTCVLLLSLVLCGTIACNTTAAEGDKSEWYKTSLVGLEVGPTGTERGPETGKRYAANFNGRDVVQRAVEANSDYLVIWARDGWFAYYDSKVLPKPEGMGKRDILRETMEEAKKHDLPVIAYCVVQYGSRATQEHPEFRMVAADGKPFERNCFNSGYPEYVEKLIAEILAYGVDGLHLDMLDQGFGGPYGCWCESCKSLFEKRYGQPMPKGITWDEDWDRMLQFRYDTSARLEKRLTAFIRKTAPGVTVDYNYHGNPPFAWRVGQRPVQHGQNGDFITGETGIWGFSALGVGLNARFYAAATPGLPVQVVMQRGVRMYHDQTTRPLIDMRWELLTLLAHSSFVTIVDKTAYDGWLDPVAYERFGKAFTDAKARQEHFGHPVVEDVGIYFSHRTRDWYGQNEPEKYFRSFQGAHLTMVYEHIPWGVLLDETASLDSLKRFPVVVLPNVNILSDHEVKVLRDYAHSGGQLVLTGFTGLFDKMGKARDASVLSDLVGAKLERRLESIDNHVRLGKEQATLPGLSKGIREKWPFLVKGPAVVWKPTTGQPIGELLKPHRSDLQKEGRVGYDWPLSADDPVGPAAILHRLGKGRVLTLATSPDYASTSEHRIVEARLLLRNAVESLRPASLVTIDAPKNVEAVVTHDEASKTIRVHLLGYQAPPTTTPPKNRPFTLPALIEDAPIFRARIDVQPEIAKATVLNDTSRIDRAKQRLDVLVEDVHEVVVIRYR
ncbi:MAG: alpha-amylase family protein [Planctomycetota bacterium]